MALTSDDKVLSISSKNGDSKVEIPLQGDPSNVQFNEIKTDQRYGEENTVSINKLRDWKYGNQSPPPPQKTIEHCRKKVSHFSNIAQKYKKFCT